MFKYDLLTQILFAIRDLFSRKLFFNLKKYCSGDVLDVGGASFYQTAIQKEVPFKSWTVLEMSEYATKEPLPSNVRFLIGDGTNLSFQNESFDTIVNIQVLEHTFEPFKMFSECVRVLKKGGYGIFLVPQTSAMHLAPYHYQNFLRFWLEEACKRTNVEIVHLEPFGGLWRSQAAKMFHFFMSALKRKGNTFSGVVRGKLFYLLFPFMVIYAVVNIPLCLILSLGDLAEEPPNHLLIFKK